MLKTKPLFAICFLSFFFSCKNEVALTFSETNFTSKKNTIVEVNIPITNENGDASKSINSAIKDFVISALQIGDSNESKVKSVEESIEKFNAEYSNFIDEFPDSAQQWEAQIDGEVIFKNKDIISVSLTSYINTGGAHGNLNISFLNFDASTGQLIENHQLFKKIEDFKTLVKKYFDVESEGKDLFSDDGDFTLPANIGFSDDGVILLYNTYEVAPYATGIIEFTIPFEESKPHLVFNNF